jgi:ribonuclease P protein component
MAPAATPVARFGISVGKRSAKSAVQRNRIKRRARELFRRHGLKQSKADLVVTLTSRFDISHIDQLMTELAGLWTPRARGPRADARDPRHVHPRLSLPAESLVGTALPF